MNKVTIIGSGRVGSTIAYSLTCRGLAQEIVIIDIAADRLAGWKFGAEGACKEACNA